MKPKTIQDLRAEIHTVGYCEKRMRYFRRKYKIFSWLLASSSPYLDHEKILVKALRCEKKAEWYRRRDDWDIARPCPCYIPEESEPVIELELTERLYRVAIANYGKDARDIFVNIFHISIPEEWNN